MSGLTTIASSFYILEAHVIRTALEWRGIPAFVKDEHIVRLAWHYANAVGGVKVQVRDEDAERAQRVIRNQPDWQESEFVALLPQDDFTSRCPACGSHNTFPKQRFSLVLSLVISLGIWLPFGHMIPIPIWCYCCLSCRHRWYGRKYFAA